MSDPANVPVVREPCAECGWEDCYECETCGFPECLEQCPDCVGEDEDDE